MHDTYLNQNIYDAILDLCRKHTIKKVDKLVITVHTDSHVSEKSLHDFFNDKHSQIVGDWTKITVLRKQIEKLTAVIENISGE